MTGVSQGSSGLEREIRSPGIFLVSRQERHRVTQTRIPPFLFFLTGYFLCNQLLKGEKIKPSLRLRGDGALDTEKWNSITGRNSGMSLVTQDPFQVAGIKPSSPRQTFRKEKKKERIPWSGAPSRIYSGSRLASTSHQEAPQYLFLSTLPFSPCLSLYFFHLSQSFCFSLSFFYFYLIWYFSSSSGSLHDCNVFDLVVTLWLKRLWIQTPAPSCWAPERGPWAWPLIKTPERGPWARPLIKTPDHAT